MSSPALAPKNSPAKPAKSRSLKNKRDKSRRLSNIRKSIQESHFNRYISHDLAGYERRVAQGGVKLYSDKELAELKAADVSKRLPPRATNYYLDLASRSQAITNLIKARPEEMEDLSGEKDPSNQLKYSPVPGLLHKYELILLYVVRTCSSWCRYCYRSDFLTSKTEKDIASVKDIADYIKSYNAKIAEEKSSGTSKDQHIVESTSEKFPIREALLSGGDPMVLSNNNLFDYLDGLAEAGLKTIRIGTKELAFFPHRFDDNFLAMLDLFHSLHPDVNLAFMVHFSHPDELLLKDEKGEYVMKANGYHARIPAVEKAIHALRSRNFITLENQAPIIDGVNDNAESLRRLQIELKRIGVNNHYFFQCREIEGHRIFAVPVEKAWKIHRDSQKGLSGIEKSRFAMSTEQGKLEVIGLLDAPNFKKMGIDLPAEAQAIISAIIGEGLIFFKAHRAPDTSFQGDLVVARRNPKALWISGYQDRIIYDGRKKDDERWSPLGKFLQTLLAPIGGMEKAEELLKSVVH